MRIPRILPKFQIIILLALIAISISYHISEEECLKRGCSPTTSVKNISREAALQFMLYDLLLPVELDYNGFSYILVLNIM